MAIGATCVWEIRNSGASTNGGGYTSGGTDYSQQDAAQLSLTDLACLTASTTLTSATGGFTSAMVGNLIQIASGTNFAAGFYEITVYTDTNTVTIDRTAASGGDASSGVGKVGGAVTLFEDINGAWVAGNTLWSKTGTYTATQSYNWSTSDGTKTLPIFFKGYNSSRGDNPTEDDRPLLAMGAYYYSLGDYFLKNHLRVTTTHTSNFASGIGSTSKNVKIVNSSGTANRYAHYIIFGARQSFIDCEGESTNGYAIGGYSYVKVFGCYFHDSSTGIYVSAYNWSILFSIIDTCTTGISIAATYFISICNSTIYNSTTGISGSTAYNVMLFNNIIKDNTTGASWTTATPSNVWDYNNWHGNTSDVSNVTKGDNATAVDPQFTDAAGGDFSLGSGSGCIDAGFSIRLGVG